MNFVAMDFETANREKHSAVSIALAVVRDNQVVDKFYSLIKPETTFSSYNTAIHGLHRQDVADAPKFPEVWQTISPFFTENKLVVAHNASFDNGILKGTLQYYDIDEPHYLLLDTVQTSRKLFPNFENHKLSTVAGNLGITLDHHHNALDDAVAAANILIYESNHFGAEVLKPYVKNK
ncbi:MAG: 3'-5' exonuclease [Leuconostoc suionicum]|uniref:3'-5' exonuclease n=1 Tax=Leuconostoc suionicum TaxID=1511761 RepID=UPI0021A976AC|nr:3'-5' exonuclease [Leuconostoc suionicum]MCT4376725.1 exonuclease [Leuconostoc suionicum]